LHSAALLLFVANLGLGLHGFSLPLWHDVIDGSKHSEVLLGQERPILSDSWGVYLPMIFSQRHSPTPFSTVSPVMGDPSMSTTAMFPVPVAHWLSFARPQLWGYFLGDDLGLAWHWAFFILLTFEAFFLLARTVGGAQRGFAAGIGIAATLSPLLQFWGMVDAPYVSFAALGGVCFWKSWTAVGTTRRVGWSLAAGYLATCLALLMYPPYAVTLAYWLLFLLAGIWFTLPRATVASAGERLSLLVVAGVLPAAALAVFAVSQAEVLRLIQGTLYPGVRAFSGGEAPILHNVLSWFVPQVWRIRNWGGYLPNLCEAASSLSLAPFLLAVSIHRYRVERRVDPIIVAMFGYLALIGVWQAIGFPLPLAKATFWSKVPTVRAQLGIIPAEMLIASRLFGSGDIQPVRAPIPLAIAAATCFSAALLAGLWIVKHLVPLNAGRVFFGALSFTLVCLAFLAVPRRAPWVLAAVAAILTVGFNPMVRGGSRWLKGNPLARAMREANQRHPGSRWLVMNDGILGNYPRLLGIHGLNGIHFYPQLAFWKALDPTGAKESEWNRYASVNVFLDRGPVRIHSPQSDGVEVFLDPLSREFERLRVDYVLLRGGPPDIATAFGPAKVEYEAAGLRIVRIGGSGG
jgi:hypothetical protein